MAKEKTTNLSAAETHITRKITLPRLMAAMEPGRLDDMGFCVACGEDAYGVEPDAQNYTCEMCGAPSVYGAEEILTRLVSVRGNGALELLLEVPRGAAH